MHGVRGWLKIFSYTEPRDNILKFPFWLVECGVSQTGRFSLEDGGWRGKTLVAKLSGIDTREEAVSMIGRKIFVERAELPELSENQFYWVDLVGLMVFTEHGVSLGIIEDLLETGANDVMVVRGKRERLIPFVRDQVVKSVDLEQGRLVVSWDPDF